MRWLAAHTWLIALVPLVTIIWLSGYIGKPLNLLKNTEVAYLDKDTVWAMWLLSEGQVRAKTVRYEAEVESGGKVLLYLQRDSLAMPAMGDILLVQTMVKRGGQLGDLNALKLSELILDARFPRMRTLSKYMQTSGTTA